MRMKKRHATRLTYRIRDKFFGYKGCRRPHHAAEAKDR